MRSKEYILIFILLFPAIFTVGQTSRLIDSLERELPLIHEELPKLDMLMQLGELLNFIRPDDALTYALEANDIALEQGDKVKYAETLSLLANAYWAKSEFQISLGYAMKAMSVAEAGGAYDIVAEAHRMLGKIYTDIGEFTKSSDEFFTSLKLYEEIGDEDGVSSALNSIGYLYYEQANYDKALEYYQKSLKISREINNPSGISRGLNNVAAVYLVLDAQSEVASYLYEAVKINKSIGQRFWVGVNYLNLSDINEERQDYDSAYLYLNMAEQIFLDLHNYTKLTSTYLQYSDFYKTINQIDSAFYYATKAYNLSNDNGLLRLLKDSAERLHDLYKNENDLENAYKFGMIQFATADSLAIEGSSTKLANLDLKYNFEKQEHEKTIYQQRKDFFVIILIISLVLVAVIAILLFTRQRFRARHSLVQKQRLQDQIDYKNKELQVNVMNLIKKNEILTEISLRLLDIKDKAVREETRTAIIKVANDIRKTTDTEIWNEFELRFKEVHGEFYLRLLETFPELSPNEQKLCAFLRLNLSSKEISEITGQQVSAIEMARHRLRKKMGITNTQTNLITFLSQI